MSSCYTRVASCLLLGNRALRSGCLKQSTIVLMFPASLHVLPTLHSLVPPCLVLGLHIAAICACFWLMTILSLLPLTPVCSICGGEMMPLLPILVMTLLIKSGSVTSEPRCLFAVHHGLCYACRQPEADIPHRHSSHSAGLGHDSCAWGLCWEPLHSCPLGKPEVGH